MTSDEAIDWLIEHQRCVCVSECFADAPSDIRDEVRRLGLSRNAIGLPFEQAHNATGVTDEP